MGKKIYLINNEFTKKSNSTIGFSLNKPYKVIDESKRKFNIYHTKYLRIERKYKVADDYGNIRWISAEWFYELDELRDEKLENLLDEKSNLYRESKS